MRILKRVVKIALVIVALLATVSGVLYLAGFRILLDGFGGVSLHRPKSPEQQAAEIARHREAQRASAPAALPSPPGSPAASSSAAVAAPEAATSPVPARSAYWTGFRGPARDGHYQQRAILTAWPASGLQPMWKQPVGSGHASFVIADRRAFTIEQRAAEEVVASYDLETGRELWTNVWQARFDEGSGGAGPRATPAWHDGTVYALGALGELRALDAASGRVRWRTNVLEDAGASRPSWGLSASPLVAGDTVIVLPGGSSGRSVVAYDRHTGKRAWSALDDDAGYSSPMRVTLAGLDHVVVFTPARLVGLSLDGGRVLWEHPWVSGNGANPSQPLAIDGERLFVSTGDAAMLAFARDGERLAVRELWRTHRMKNQFSSSVHHDGFIYGLDHGILACLDADSGELKWKGGRYGYGQMLLASGHLIVVTEDGQLVLVRATPERHVEVSRAAALEGRTWNHPAMSDGYLLIRNGNEMAAYDLRGGSERAPGSIP